MKRAVRAWFDARGFTEIEAGQLQASPGNETHLHALATNVLTPDGVAKPMYLHTSPEFACKKLLAAGETKIYDFARVFRNREAGPLHATEFTMLEWYRTGADWQMMMSDTLDLVRVAAQAVPTDTAAWRDHKVVLAQEAQILTLQDAFAHYAQIDLLATVNHMGVGHRNALAQAAQAQAIRFTDDDTWSDIFSKVLVEKIEPFLGIKVPTFLCDYPACEAALARRNVLDPRLSERFELYVCGVELANGFGELTDPVEQRARFEADMAKKLEIYGETYPLDEDFLAALAIMPPASGVALGFDRLVMLTTGARRIGDVLWTAH